MQNTSHAVMAQRAEPNDSLDFFPTPPWATRALCEWLRQDLHPLADETAWEPACGQGHMARSLREYFRAVITTDVHDYGYGAVEDFLFSGTKRRCDWLITNPPFRLAQQFVLKAQSVAELGIAMLVRTVFLESGQRWQEMYRHNPPSDVLIFCERVPMLKGRLDPRASSATSYAWFVWRKNAEAGTRLHWIPPGTRKRLERERDYDQPTEISTGGFT